LDPEDERQFDLMLAGPAALIVAKVHKIMDRQGDVDRRSDKDALDLYRLLRVVPTRDLAQRFRTLQADPLSRQVAETAHRMLPNLFGRARAPGIQMAVRATYPLESDETLGASIVALTQDLLSELR
jgi:hypothetical protein